MNEETYMSSQNVNPLKQFYRTAKLSVRLPSRGLYYQDEVEFNPNHEIDILPMTAADEIMLKNADALLTGEAIIDLLKSCVPQVKAPRKLLSCDIETLLVGIRAASYSEDLLMKIDCPSCKKENTYAMDFETVLNQTEEIQEEYVAHLPNHVNVYVKPGTFDAIMKRQRILLDNQKIRRILEQDDLSDEQRLQHLNSVFTKAGQMNYEMIVDGIEKIEFTDETGETVIVTNRAHIDEYVRNIQREDVDKIEEQLRAVNSVGIAKEMKAVCTSCGHEWDAPIEFNPVNFS